MTKTYAQLTREIQALQASAEKLRAAEVKSVIAKLNESIAAYELTADDLHFPGAASASGGRRGTSAATASRSDASTDAKYSDGQGNRWGGRGPRPAWLRQAILNGKSLESFETSGASSAGTRAAKTTGGNAKSQTAASKVKLPPLYGHPKTGKTWSGRGPKPAWLKQGLKKRGASIDDFLISTHASAPAEAAAPASAPAQPQSGRAKPAANAPSTATRKSLGEKVASRSKSSNDSTPETATKSAPAVPARKAAASGKAAAKKTKASPATGAAGATAAKAPARKVAAKPAAKQAGSKPSAKTTGAPRKNLPSSMAPSADAAPAPSTVPAAAPMPVPQSDSVEGRGETAGA